ncbi:hypothetical protein [uncultured Methylobacterium sp.]|uniref:hypothetical protein n=1 Tax=uncultured Methylobacterium sp. TaxID=157278 RepID=UPI0035C9D53B
MILLALAAALALFALTAAVRAFEHLAGRDNVHFAFHIVTASSCVVSAILLVDMAIGRLA